MKLKAKVTPYSSVVGGGLTLLDERGRVAFLVAFMGASSGITKAETAALASQFAAWSKEYGLTVPDRPDGAKP